jgi:predicted nucleic acid-binding protein
LSVVVDTNVLIELFLPTQNAKAVQALWTAEPDWWLPALWICEFRHVHLKFLRAGRLDLNTALDNLSDAEKAFLPQTVAIDSAEALRLAAQHGCSSYDAEFVVLAQQLACPLLTFDQKLLNLFPTVAVKPGS